MANKHHGRLKGQTKVENNNAILYKLYNSILGGSFNETSKGYYLGKVASK